MTGLAPGFYQVATTWPATPGNSYGTYSLYDGALLLGTTNVVNQAVAPSDFTDSGTAWKNLGLVYVAGGSLTVQLNDYSSSGYQAVADAIRVQAVVGDHGTDDNFHISSSSATIDTGDPS